MYCLKSNQMDSYRIKDDCENLVFIGRVLDLVVKNWGWLIKLNTEVVLGDLGYYSELLF